MLNLKFEKWDATILNNEVPVKAARRRAANGRNSFWVARDFPPWKARIPAISRPATTGQAGGTSRRDEGAEQGKP